MPTAPFPPSTQPAASRLLIVDDEVELLTVLSNTLSREGFEVVGASSGSEALEMLREQPPFDLLLTDLMMPGLDGLGLLKAALDLDPQLVCVMMTGQGTVQTAVDAMKVGAFDYVLKPFKLSAMLPVLTRAMEARRLRVENLQLRESVAIYELAQTLAFTLDTDTILAKLADAALQQSEADEASVMLPAPEGEALVVAAVRGEGRSYILGERVPLAMGIAGWVARFREMLELKGEVQDPRFAPIHPRPEIRHALCVPMLAGNDFVGVLNVNLIRQRRPFTLRDVKALSILAGLGAAALQNARLLAQVQAGEKRFRALIENASDAIALVSADGTILYESPSVTRVLGYAVGERTGRKFFELVHPDDLPDMTNKFSQLLQQPGAIVGAQLRYRHKDGSWRWLESTGQNLLAEPGVEAIVANYRDITKRRMAQEALRESEDRYRDLIEHIHDLICTHDLEGQILSANQSASKMLGYAPHELVGKNLRDILAPEVRHEFDNYLSTIQQKGAAHGLMLVETRSGERRIWEYDNSLRIEGVSAPIVRGFARDITERKQAEETIRQAEQRYRQLFEEAPAMYVITRNQESGPVVADCNELFLTTSGYTRAEVVGQPLADFYTPASRAKMLAGDYQRALKGEFLSEEREFVGRDGRIIETLLRTMPEVAPDGQITGTRAMYVDVTERKQAEEALRNAEARYRVIFEQSPNGILLIDLETGKTLEANETAHKQLGYTREEFAALRISDYEALEKSEETAKHMQKVIREGSDDFETLHRTKSGEIRNVRVWAKTLSLGDRVLFYAIFQDITERKQAEEETRLLLALTQAINEAPSFDSALRMALQKVCESTDWDMGEAWIPRADGSALELSPVRYGRRPGLETFSADSQSFVFPPGKGLPGRVWVSRQPEWLKVVSADGEIFPRAALALKAGIKSALAVPTLAGDQMLVLVFFMKEAREEEGRLVEIVSAAAAQLGSLFQRKRAEERLRQSESSLRESQIIAGLGSYVLDFSTGLWKSSGILDKIFGIDETYVRSVEGWADLIHPDERQQMLGYFTNEVIGRRVRFDKEYKIIRKNDHAERWVYGVGELEVDAQNQLLKMHGTITDITERKQAEEALRENEQRLQVALSSVNMAVFNQDRALRYTWMYQPQLGYRPEQVVGHTDAELLPPEAARRVTEIKQRVLETGGGAHEEVSVAAEGATLVYDLTAAPLRDASGAIIGLTGATLDITERKRAEEKLLLSDEILRIVQALVLVADAEGRITYANSAFETLLGYEPGDLLGDGWWILSRPDPDARERERSHVARVAAGEVPIESAPYERLVARRDGGARWIAWYDVKGPGRTLIGVGHDITERKQAEEQIQRRNTELAALNRIGQVLSRLASSSEIVELLFTVIGQVLDNRNLYIALCDEANQTLSFPVYTIQGERREAGSRPFGNGLTEYVIRTGAPLLIPRNQPAFLTEQGIKLIGTPSKCFLAAPMRVGERVTGVIAIQDYENEDIYHAGYLELMGTLAAQAAIALENSRLYVAVQQELDERKRAEEALRLSEEKYRTLVDEVNDGFYVTDSAGVFTFANPALARMHGFESPEALVGRGFADFVAPEMQADLGEAYRTAMQAGRTPEVINGQIVRPDGTRAFIEIKTAFMVKDGQIVGSQGVVRDITERKQREQELEAIATVSTALRVAQTRVEMLPIILDQLLNRLNAQGAALAMRDPGSGETVFELARGEWANWTGLRLPPGVGVCGHVIATGQPYLNNNALADPLAAQPESFGDLRAVADVPLIAREQTIGALRVGRRSDITRDELRLLSAIGDIAANAIHRAALHEQTERRAEQLTALHTIDAAISSSLDLRLTLDVLLDQVMTQLGVDATTVLLFNPHLQTLAYAAGRGFRGKDIEHSRLRLGQGYAGRAALERRTVQLPNLAEEEPDLARALTFAGEDFRAYYGVPLIAKGQVEGVLEIFHRAPLHPDRDWVDFLEALAGQAAIAIDSAQLFDSLQRSNLQLSLAYDATIEGWSRALDLRDKETEGHTRRVTETTLKLARAMGLGEEELVHVRRGALLHDIGKMGVPDGILLKPGPLTDEEWVIMRKHPVYAHEMLAPIVYLRPALDIPYCHHEKWDGTGYPRGLRGEAIPLAARLFAVVDVWDALLSDRPYRPGWPEEKVRAHIRSLAGTHFDSQVADMFLQMIAPNSQAG